MLTLESNVTRSCDANVYLPWRFCKLNSRFMHDFLLNPFAMSKEFLLDENEGAFIMKDEIMDDKE